MILWLIFGLYTCPRDRGWVPFGPNLLLFILLFLLGWSAFGFIIQGGGSRPGGP